MCWPSGCQISLNSCGRNKPWFLIEVTNLQRTLNRKSLSVYKKSNLIKLTQKRYLESGGRHRLFQKHWERQEPVWKSRGPTANEAAELCCCFLNFYEAVPVRSGWGNGLQQTHDTAGPQSITVDLKARGT